MIYIVYVFTYKDLFLKKRKKERNYIYILFWTSLKKFIFGRFLQLNIHIFQHIF